MQSKSVCAVLILIAALILGAPSVHQVSAQTYGYGPRSSELMLVNFGDETALYSALKAGVIELPLAPLTRAQYQDAITDPNIILCSVFRLNLIAFSLNNNDTIGAYPGVRSATSYVDFRKALWCMVDRDYYTQVVCGGFATPVYVPVAAPSRSWVNVTVENYVKTSYAFNLLVASNYLDAGGFTQRVGDTNPYYDPNVPGSAQYWRGYPATHPQKPGQRIDPVVFSARVDDGLRYAASVHLRDQMLKSGIQVNFISEPSSSAYIRVMTARNYQIYSASWSVGRFATYQYNWLHTSRWIPGGSNYHVSATSTGYVTTSGSPDNLDEKLEKMQFPVSLGEAIAASKDSQGLSVQKYASFIPLWSTIAFFAYRNLYGVMNMEGVGPENIYTFLNAWRADGGIKMRVGQASPPTQVNQIYSSWPYDITTMSFTMDDFKVVDPYTLFFDQPWLAQDWTNAQEPGSAPGTWVDPDDGQTKSYLRYWFRDDPNDGLGDTDAEWIKPGLPGDGGGSVLADFTPQWLGGGYEFNSWYYDTEPAGWLYSSYKDIKHIVCNPAGKYADVYFDTSSSWSKYLAYGRLLYSQQPASIDQTSLGWKQAPLSSQETRNFAGPIAAGTYLHTLTPVSGSPIPRRARGSPVEVIEVRLDGVLQTVATTPQLFDPSTGLGAGGDYRIVGTSANGPSIRFYKDVAAGSTLTVTYWARGTPAGYWPGNTNFRTTLAGTGSFYMTDFLAGVGGYATYRANPHYFMETPLKGEIDWYWYWIEGTQPRDGCFRIDLYDAVPACYAVYGYGRGTGIPNVYWLPSLDLCAPLGELNIWDMAIFGYYYAYDATFGSPYPNPPP